MSENISGSNKKGVLNILTILLSLLCGILGGYLSTYYELDNLFVNDTTTSQPKPLSRDNKEVTVDQEGSLSFEVISPNISSKGNLVFTPEQDMVINRGNLKLSDSWADISGENLQIYGEGNTDIYLQPNGGSVGVGTTNAQYTLHVLGDVGFSGELMEGIVPWERLTDIVSVDTGQGLEGGGQLTEDITISLSNTAVDQGTYGSSEEIPIITVNSRGQITNATVQRITIPDPVEISNTGNSNTVAASTSYVYTVNQDLNNKINNKVSKSGDAITGDLMFNGGTRYIGTSDGYAFVIRTSNTDRITVTNAGKVGIGTSNPTYSLHTFGDIGFTGTLQEGTVPWGRLTSHPTITTGTGLEGGGDLSTNRTVSLSDTTVIAGTYGASGGIEYPRLVVDAQGRLTGVSSEAVRTATTAQTGIVQLSDSGSSTSLAATTSYVSSVNDNANLRVLKSGDTMTGDLMFSGGTRYIGTSDSNSFVVRTNNTDRITVTSTGEVGVGIGTPQSTLHSHVGSTDATEIRISNTYTESTSSDGLVLGYASSSSDAVINNKESGALKFYTGDSEQMRIDSTGKVGVGIVAPTAHIDVTGATTTAASLRIRTGTTPNIPNTGDMYSDGTDLFYYNGSEWKNLSGSTIYDFDCPTGMIPVPASSTGRPGFCVDKYEAKQDGSVAVSQASGIPWVSITQYDARAACRAAGKRLITEEDWIHIAQDVEQVGWNWSEGTPGSGVMSDGHSDNVPANSLAASTDDDPCFGTGQTCDTSTWNSQRRTYKLSNGEYIWDFGGNVWDWVDGFTYADYPYANNWDGWIACNTPDGICGNTLATNDQRYGGITTALRALFRGGYWLDGAKSGSFSVSLSCVPSSTYSNVGFRCAW
jgi:formylglycine-generating enzyme required for sulfatase activity